LVKVETMLSGLRDTWLKAIEKMKIENCRGMTPIKHDVAGSLSISL
jgi:hypothetical protein